MERETHTHTECTGGKAHKIIKKKAFKVSNTCYLRFLMTLDNNLSYIMFNISNYGINKIIEIEILHSLKHNFNYDSYYHYL